MSTASAIDRPTSDRRGQERPAPQTPQTGTAVPEDAAVSDAGFAPNPGDLFGFADLLDDDERAIVARTRAFLEDEVAPIADRYWDAGQFPHQVLEGFRGLDIAGLMYDGAAYGRPDRARGSRLLTGFLALEMGRVDASISTFFGAHAGLAMGSIAACGSPEQQARWLPAMARMDTLGAFALTEPDRGSDIAGGLSTTATRAGDHWALDGRKRWIGNATVADVTIVWARDTSDGQVKGFIVEAGTPGFHPVEMTGKTALRIIPNAEITLEGVRVPETHRLAGADSFRDTSEVLRQTRGGVAWGSVGVMMAAYEQARDYAVTREQFGRPIAEFQLVQDRLATMLGKVTSALGMVVRLAQLQDQGINDDAHAALTKATVTTTMRETVALARETLGGNGILLEYPLARRFADAEALYTYEGTRDINHLIVGRAVTGRSAFV